MENMLEKIKEAKVYVEKKLNKKPVLGLILGSGLGILAEEIENPIKIKYDEIPHFSKSSVRYWRV
jgi:purine-nucleoside phosphorylase